MERTVYVVLDELKNEARKLAIEYAEVARMSEGVPTMTYYTRLSREYEARMCVLEAVIRELPAEVLGRLAE